MPSIGNPSKSIEMKVKRSGNAFYDKVTVTKSKTNVGIDKDETHETTFRIKTMMFCQIVE